MAKGNLMQASFVYTHYFAFLQEESVFSYVDFSFYLSLDIYFPYLCVTAFQLDIRTLLICIAFSDPLFCALLPFQEKYLEIKFIIRQVIKLS